MKNPNAALMAFVRARLAEEEALARAAGADSWRCPPDLPGEVHDANGTVAFTLKGFGYDRHTAYQDPARTLRRIETSRVLVDEYEEVAELDVDRPDQTFRAGRAVGLGFVVRQLAAEHAGHPEYKAGWLPRFFQ
ncbi:MULTISPECIES: DUF6221 family protein [unclassified Streptomyces]|uniref:DUF6221 family protein n=1 Tax=unclassified Streptomyces TaxID=2593676 RepID=UPI002E29BE7D|nr:DUF6221 family protein [Streptomyces sp. NBC_01429]